VWYGRPGQKQKGFLSSSLLIQMHSLPLSAHKKKKEKEKKKRKERNLCKEKGQAWFSATPRVIFIL